ncbi:hypothetical protein [Bradyrhizobium sp. NP1]|uniref:hypothetical protein n=1 Tax=Bradyrhizobium sp. NP1 TaxID=3049772 RepID=UPI0025A4E94F|nr:hypothetical protein [Bradyrhizobium sp. NP1]WJR76992.1 hypothetical protein QOU61_30270 [Bradyrhizobium sp. NP1]
MPAFSFEKIAPPARRNPTAPAEKKPRGMIVQILDRFAGARAKRASRDEQSAMARRGDKPGK